MSARDALLLLLVTAALVGCGFLLWPFVPALTGLGLIAMITRRPFHAVQQRIPNRTFAACVAVLCVTVCIIAPVGLGIHLVANRVIGVASLLRTPDAIQRIRMVEESVRSLLLRHSVPVPDIDPNSIFDNVSAPIASGAMSLLGGSVATVTQLVLMLFLLFFWYRRGDSLNNAARNVLPFTAGERRFLIRVMLRTVRAVAVGRITVAAIQAFLAWVVFLLLAIPGASPLAAVTFMCCVLPAVGAFFVWIPVTIYLLLIHAWTRAIILGLVGTLVLSSVDNVLQAFISGNQARMGTVEMFLSMIGGVWVLGIPGLVLGPLIWVTAGGLLVIWNKRQQRMRELGLAA